METPFYRRLRGRFAFYLVEVEQVIWWKLNKTFIFARFGCVIFHHLLGHITQKLVDGRSGEG